MKTHLDKETKENNRKSKRSKDEGMVILMESTSDNLPWSTSFLLPWTTTCPGVHRSYLNANATWLLSFQKTEWPSWVNFRLLIKLFSSRAAARKSSQPLHYSRCSFSELLRWEVWANAIEVWAFLFNLCWSGILIALAQTLIALAQTLIALAHTLIALAHTLIAVAHTLIALTHLNSTEKLH